MSQGTQGARDAVDEQWRRQVLEALRAILDEIKALHNDLPAIEDEEEL